MEGIWHIPIFQVDLVIPGKNAFYVSYKYHTKYPNVRCLIQTCQKYQEIPKTILYIEYHFPELFDKGFTLYEYFSIRKDRNVIQ